MEFVRVITFAEFKKKVRSVARATLRLSGERWSSILKDHSSNAVRILYLELLEVNKPFATDLFAFGIIYFKPLKTVYVLFARTKRNMFYAKPKANHFQFPKG